MSKSDLLRIGAGAAYAGDRIEPALELAEKGGIDYLVFECLAERTIALAQLSKLKNSQQGYDPMLVKRMQTVLPTCIKKGIRIISNMGAANPVAAAEKIIELAPSLGIDRIKVAAVVGDNVLSFFQSGAYPLPDPVSSDNLVSANAYIGVEALIEALESGADVILAGRVADPSLFLAPMVYEFGWEADNWPLLGQGTVIGHLMECAGQVTGGYFADPTRKDVNDLARLGFPIAEISSNGEACITKVKGTGGQVTTATCREQLLYELHDPSSYLTPDVTADFSQVVFEEAGPDRVMVRGGSGKQRPEQLKVSVGYRDGYRGEGQISYAGVGAAERGQLALEIVKQRLAITNVPVRELRDELIGMNSIAREHSVPDQYQPYEVRARIAGRTGTTEAAQAIADEVETLYTNGPAGGGGVSKDIREVIAIASSYIDRKVINPETVLLGK